MLVGVAELLVPVADRDVVVVLRCEESVTVPLMMLSVTMPPPPTSNETTLVDPLDVEVMVLESVVRLPVLEQDEPEQALVLDAEPDREDDEDPEVDAYLVLAVI